ncbi:hypothetical protein FG386_000445 [Cryptosporidium ryanae]|uniref:uncharacterized protein n=1 Tax=Cryptosporidium ryanae TaxID=515981 RepID=UPI00351A43A6|nr:hypothetical protein FG386_000445 [Cryptosporidium ryanae]
MFLLLFFYLNTLVLGVSLFHSLGLLNFGISALKYTCMYLSVHLEASKNKLKYSLLIGPSGSGKTTLLYQLKYGRFCDTTTSVIPAKMKVNDQHYLVDIPGNRRIINNYIMKYINCSNSVIFVLDSSNRSSFKEAAEIIYFTIFNILKGSSEIRGRKASGFPEYKFIILCNKSDLSSSKNFKYIREELERNIDKINANDNDLLDVNVRGEVKNFSFETLTSFDLQFLETSLISIDERVFETIRSVLSN